MIIKHSTDEILNNINTGKVILDFYGTYCGPCQMLSSILDQVTEGEIPNDVTLVKINVDNIPELAGEYSVLNIPTLVKLIDGEEKERRSGFMPKNILIDFINHDNYK